MGDWKGIGGWTWGRVMIKFSVEMYKLFKEEIKLKHWKALRHGSICRALNTTSRQDSCEGNIVLLNYTRDGHRRTLWIITNSLWQKLKYNTGIYMNDFVSPSHAYQQLLGPLCSGLMLCFKFSWLETMKNPPSLSFLESGHTWRTCNSSFGHMQSLWKQVDRRWLTPPPVFVLLEETTKSPWWGGEDLLSMKDPSFSFLLSTPAICLYFFKMQIALTGFTDLLLLLSFLQPCWENGICTKGQIFVM